MAREAAGRLTAERSARSFSKGDDLVARRQLIRVEHRHLKMRPVVADLVHQLPGHRLDDPVDMNRLCADMRPEADVDLVGLNEFTQRGGDPAKQRAELRGLRLLEVQT
jgi:hypothetical protein